MFDPVFGLPVKHRDHFIRSLSACLCESVCPVIVTQLNWTIRLYSAVVIFIHILVFVCIFVHVFMSKTVQVPSVDS